MTGVPVDVWLMDVVIKGHIISIEQGDQPKGVAWIRLGCCGIEDRGGPLPSNRAKSAQTRVLHRESWRSKGTVSRSAARGCYRNPQPIGPMSAAEPRFTGKERQQQGRRPRRADRRADRRPAQIEFKDGVGSSDLGRERRIGPGKCSTCLVVGFNSQSDDIVSDSG